MRAYCHEAQKFGELICPQGTAPRHVTVLLNPRTKGSKNLYEDYAAPLLHLAGMKVSLFRTEHAGQATELMKIMDNTDAVIVSGGDGTVSEAVTGLLNRADWLAASERFPMGFVPTGKTNTLVRKLFFRYGMREQQLAAEAALAVIHGVKARIDAFKVEFHNEKLWTREEDTHGKMLMRLCQKDLEVEGITNTVLPKNSEPLEPIAKQTDSEREIAHENANQQPFLENTDPVFGVGKIEYGIFRDIDANIDRYWFFGPLRARVAYLFECLRRNPISEETEIRISDVCSGCKQCLMRGYSNETEKQNNEIRSPTKARWWSSYVKRDTKPNKGPVNPFEKYSGVNNEKCGKMYDASICYTNLEVEPENGALAVRASPATLRSSEALFNGFTRHSSYKTPCITEQLRAGKIQFDFPQKELIDPANIPTPEEKRNREIRFKGPKVNIDSEVFARQPMTIVLFPRAINVFVPAR
ncbi:acylglycerol kinase [Tropilaelaps mercedesae]|uniref:Acylglycerol kinase, mitochondrial n=1 Tax=Tropilaelaps mercedesae TaxID=418985 RepID=A0A1V9X301_9ACAR|nr:acylglycerol kinase [Tropilaelaps mercedesae]